MTIAVSLKVNDGVVLAADSASTMTVDGGDVINVYNNANKVFNLYKGLPIGLATWGLGALGGLSISILAKDLRRRFSGDDPNHADWKIDPENYELADVAARVADFFYDEHYQPAVEATTGEEPGEPPTGMGFFIAGYSSANHHPEEFILELSPAGSDGPRPMGEIGGHGVAWSGQIDAINRLVNGYSTGLGDVLIDDFGLDPDDLTTALETVGGRLGAPLVVPGMPFQDAIDLAEWLVSVAIGYARFMPGWPNVGGPIETAAISKHEGFKWIRRKHYYEARLNPPEAK